MSTDNLSTSFAPSGAQTPSVKTDVLTIQNKTIRQFTDDFTSNDPQSVPTSKALFDSLEDLQNRIALLDPNNPYLQDNYVISMSLVSPKFDGVEWAYAGYTKNASGGLTYVGSMANALSILSNAFTSEGYYFFVLEVTRLDSGRVIVTDENDNVLLNIVTSGKYYVERYVGSGSLSTARIKVTIEDVVAQDRVVLSTSSLHHVRQRMKDYLVFMSAMLSGGTAFATIEYVNQAIVEALATSGTGALQAALQAHIQANNPHGITPGGIGAAPAIHTHGEYATITGVNTSLTNMTTSLQNYADNAAITASNNAIVHSNTQDSVTLNAARSYADQITSALEIAIRNEYRQYTDTALASANSYTDGKFNPLQSSFTAHINAVNPHEITPAGIGASPEGHGHHITEIDGFDVSDINVGLDVAKLIVNNAERVACPFVLSNNSITPATATLLSNRLLHTEERLFDYNSGYIYSNVEAIEGTEVYDVFLLPTESKPNPIGKFAPLSSGELAVFGYSIGFSRHISHIVVTRENDTTAVLEWEITDEYGIQAATGNLVWAVGETEKILELTDLVDPAGWYAKNFQFRVLDVDIGVADYWSLHLDVFFMADHELYIPDEVSVATGIDNLTKLISTIGDTPVTVDPRYRIDGERYLVLGHYTRNGMRFEDANLTPIGLSVDNEIKGLPIFEGLYADEEPHQVYGAVSATNIGTGSSIGNLFTRDKDSIFVTNYGVHSLTIEHEFNIELPFWGVDIVFFHESYVAGQIPESIAFDLLVDDGNGGYVYEPWITVPTYVPCFSVFGSAFIAVSRDSLLDVRMIKGYRCVLNTTKNNGIAIGELRTRYVDMHIDPDKNITSNASNVLKCPIGVVQYVEGPNGSGYFKPLSIASTVVTYLPVNGMERTTVNGYYIVHNPFMTLKGVTLDLQGMSESENGLQPMGTVVERNDRYFVVRTSTEHIFRLKVVREW